MYFHILGYSLGRGPEFSVVARVRMKQSEPKKYTTYRDVCVIDCSTNDLFSARHFSPLRAMFLDVSASISGGEG